MAGKLPTMEKEAKIICKRAKNFKMVKGILNKQGASVSLLRCILPKEAHYVLIEIHKGICGSHSDGRALAGKALKVGY